MRAQPRLNTDPLSRGALRQTQFEIDQLLGLLQMEPDSNTREIRQLQREYSRLLDRFEKIQFEQVTRLGFYTPRAPDGSAVKFNWTLDDLNRHQRYRFKQAAARARSTIENNRVALIPSRMGKADREVLKRQVKSHGARMTDRAVFVPIPAGERNRTVRGPDKLEWHRDSRAFTLREEYTNRAGEKVRERYFLAGAEYVAETTDRLDQLWSRAGVDPRKHDVVPIYRGKHVGSRHYGNVRQLVDELSKYDTGTQARIFHGLKVLIITRGRPPKGGQVVRVLNPKTGRSTKPSAALINRVHITEKQRAAQRQARRRKKSRGK